MKDAFLPPYISMSEFLTDLLNDLENNFDEEVCDPEWLSENDNEQAFLDAAMDYKEVVL